jgi:hypothetical protein
MFKTEKTLIPVGPQFHTFLAVTGALINAVPYGKKKRRRLENRPDSVGRSIHRKKPPYWQIEGRASVIGFTITENKANNETDEVRKTVWIDLGTSRT